MVHELDPALFRRQNEEEGREGGLGILFVGHHLGFSPFCCSNFPGERFPPGGPTSPTGFIFLLHSCSRFVFSGGGIGVALELTKLSIPPLLCCSVLNFLASLRSPLHLSQNIHEQAPRLGKFSKQMILRILGGEGRTLCSFFQQSTKK